MAVTVSRIPFSGSTDGKGIKITQTATAGDIIHTATSESGAGDADEIWIYAYNSHSADVTLTLEWGGTSAPDDNIKQAIPYQAGLVLVAPGLPLRNSLVVKAFAATANVIVLYGWVNRIIET